MKKVLAILAVGYIIGIASGIFIYENSLSFAWKQYQVCADTLASERETASNLAKQQLHQWAKDKVVIDSNKLAEAIIQTTGQFDAWYYKSGNVAP